MSVLSRLKEDKRKHKSMHGCSLAGGAQADLCSHCIQMILQDVDLCCGSHQVSSEKPSEILVNT